jgi:hypothetical protein
LAGVYHNGGVFEYLSDYWKRNKKGINEAQYGVSAFKGLEQCRCSDKFK